MPTWGAILRELGESAATRGGVPDFDAVRRRYLLALQTHTGRSAILYASRFMDPALQVPPGMLTISDEDIPGLMEVIHGLPGPDLDLILHSPGGSSEAAEACVSYLRSKFRYLRAIVPVMAMSAATMVCCAADVVVMGKHSFLGPVDPHSSCRHHLASAACRHRASWSSSTKL